ncbi:putative polysaccharide biosynthesis protein [Cohnella hashimotonis]|uniref:Polysaccharide biosynthesis protein n=1 Tax=Cohnella hashimotonis TaxID=2826895 RepID=A0ABT6TBP2_9BACL|nr:polysaccharide biosynthesis protein [Cohnella hashimotonis]MDI4644257.1 polysaccharide biosynthesis protein [Cohnella hashimotonis]
MVKKDSLIKGTLILTAAALIARVIGIFQRVPLAHVMDEVGISAFSMSNNVYLLLLVFATAGIPSAVSKMVSERVELGRGDEVKRIYRAALRFGAIAGVTLTVLLLLLAPVYTWLAGTQHATLAIQAIAPSLLLFPIIAMMRGYFQGRQLMMAGGVSQVIEQIARVVTAIGVVFAMHGWGYGNEKMAAGGALGSVVGSVGAFAVMLYYAVKLRKSDEQTGELKRSGRTTDAGRRTGGLPILRTNRDIYRAIFRISIPILVTAMTVQSIYMIDQSLLTRLSEWRFGEETTLKWLADLTTNAQSIAGIPPVLAIALSQSILPVLSAAFASGDRERVTRQATLALRIGIFSGMPIVLLMTVGAHAINGLLFPNPDASVIVGMLAGGTIFQITMMTSNSILYGLGQQRLAMKHTLVGIFVKLILTLILTPIFGVYGLVSATTLCFMFATMTNMMSIRKRAGVRALGDRWTGFVATVLILSAAGGALVYAVLHLAAPLGWKWPYLLATGALGLLICAVYPVLLTALGVLRADDLESYPARIRRVLRPFLRFARGGQRVSDAR